METQPTASIGSLTPTVCRLMGVAPPHISGEPPLEAVIEFLKDQTLEKCLIYVADAIGAHLWRTRERNFKAVLKHAPLQVPLRSVDPPKTPVCMATIFTGAQPQVHGIRRPVRPVLKCDTLFDALIRSGKQVAIVAVRGCTIDLIFRDRDLDYFSEEYDPGVTARTLQLLNEDRHELIVCYQQEYDDLLHRTTPFSPECLQALRNHVHSFEMIAEAVSLHWQSHLHALVFASDHGAHTDPTSGRGDHGLHIPEDMDLYHCYGLSTSIS